MLDGSRPRQPNYLAIISSALNEVIRIHKRMAKADPIFDFARTHREAMASIQRQKMQAELDRAIANVYGVPDQQK